MELVKTIPGLNCKNCIFHEEVSSKILCRRTSDLMADERFIDENSHCGDGMWLIEVERDEKFYRVPFGRPESVFSIMNEGIDPYST